MPNSHRRLWVAVGVLSLLPACPIYIPPDVHPGELADEEKAIKIYFKNQPLPCDPYVDLGHIQASSGEEPPPDEEIEEYASFESALGWLKKEAVKRGATGVIVYDRKQAKNLSTYFVYGTAIRCPDKSDKADKPDT